VLRFLPPYIMQREHVDTAIAALNEILSEVGAGVPSMAGAHQNTGGQRNG
jgi:hypothetical protein